MNQEILKQINYLVRNARSWTMYCLFLFISTQVAAQSNVLVATNSIWKYWKGTNEPASTTSAWRLSSYSDVRWSSGSTAFYYGETGITGTAMTDMQNRYSTIYLRRTFVVAKTNDISGLTLRATCDDGFIAWINGVEVASFNRPTGDPRYNSLASTTAPEPASFANYVLEDPKNYLVQGTNILAVQVFNSSLASSDIVFNAELNYQLRETVPPVIVSFNPKSGTLTNLTQITVVFSEPVIGLEADDLWLNEEPATQLTGSGTTYTFGFPQPGMGDIQVSWNPNNTIRDLASPPNNFNFAGTNTAWQYYLYDANAPIIQKAHPPMGLTVRHLSQIEITFNEPVTGVEAKDLLINGISATNVSGFSAGPYLFEFAPVASGMAQVKWSTNNQIIDASNPPNKLTDQHWAYQVNVAEPLSDLIITEFAAENISGLLDETKQAEDWIEIYNRGTQAANLAGWSLTDEEKNPGKWVFPSVMIPAGGYLVVFASGKDITTPTTGAKMHTNFKLNLLGEYLALCSPDAPRKIVQAFSPQYLEQRNNYAYGLDSEGQWKYFSKPTPGQINGSSSITEVVSPVQFSVQRGYFRNPFSLILSTDTPASEIRYTIDGSIPSETNGIVYINPVLINTTRIVRAAAFKINFLPSVITTHSYLYGLANNRLLMPALSLVTASNNLFGATGIMEYSPRNTTKHGIAWERPVSAEFIRPEDNGGFNIDCGIRIQGGGYIRGRYNYRGSVPDSKYSFRLYFRSDYGPGKLEYPLFPNCAVESFDHIVLRAGMNDATNPYIRDEFMRRLALQTGQVGCHGTFVQLFLNGVYKGYYNPTERIDAEFLQSWHGGGENWDLVAQGAEVREGDLIAWNSLKSHINGKVQTLQANYQETAKRLDLVNFVDYLLCNIYSANSDWPWNNWRVGREHVTGALFRFYIWDAEWSFGYNHAVTWNTLTNELGRTDTDIGQFYTRLKASPEFRQLFADRAHKHMYNDGGLTDVKIRACYNELKAAVSGSISSFNDTIGTTWIPSRRANMLKHLSAAGLLMSSNAPVFSQHGGRVARGFSLSVTAPAGEIYYTTNGTDPRIPFIGAIAADAILSSGKPLVLSDSLVLKARSLNGTNWSALTEASFQVETVDMPLRITELMINPAGGDAFEFIELENTGNIALNISGVSFDGIQFRFPENYSLMAPRSRIVLISDAQPAAFYQRYPNVKVAGIYLGSLANSGEQIQLKDTKGRVIVAVNYMDGRPWPFSNGEYSIEMINVMGDPDDPANWKLSANNGGTPGSLNSPKEDYAIRLNEIMAFNASGVDTNSAHPDYVEIYNRSLNAVDISGWSLTDNMDPKRFVFPQGSVIPNGAYAVIWCDGQTQSPGYHAPFALKKEGQTVVLYDPNGVRIDIVSYGAQVSNYSVGYLEETGEWGLAIPSPGRANSQAPVASANDLYINEFLANALPNQSDWLEIYNRNSNLPASMGGMYLETSNAIVCLPALSYVPPKGFVTFTADNTAGAGNVSLKLPAAGGYLRLLDNTGGEIQRFSYPVQTENMSYGWLPDGQGSLTFFTSTPSPGTNNYVVSSPGLVINEFMAQNLTALANADGTVCDWIEIMNTNKVGVYLTGYSLSLHPKSKNRWTFPSSTYLGPGGYRVVWCNATPGFATSSEIVFPEELPDVGGRIQLYDKNDRMVDSVEYGNQLVDFSVGRVNQVWQLLSKPTPRVTNAIPALLGNIMNVRINEWLASGSGLDDWLELFNLDQRPVTLAGAFISDDPSLAGQRKFVFPPLTFIPGGGWLKLLADSTPENGNDYLNFSLSAFGECLRLYNPSLILVDSIDYDVQLPGVSEGRWPDGASTMTRFSELPTPGVANYLPPPIMLSSVGLSGSSLLMRVEGPTNSVFVLEGSVDMAEWYSLRTNAAPQGVVDFIDPQVFQKPIQFYRVLRIP